MNDKTKKNQSIKLQETPIFLKSGFSGVPISHLGGGVWAYGGHGSKWKSDPGS